MLRETTDTARSVVLTLDEVRAILDGADVIERAADVPPRGANGGVMREIVSSLLVHRGDTFDVRYNLDNPRAVTCPFGAPGDVLWVRETFASHGPQLVAYKADGLCGAWIGDGGGGRFFIHHGWVMKYERPASHELLGRRWGLGARGGRWRSPATMPRWASRLTLRVTAVALAAIGAIESGRCVWRATVERVPESQP